MHGTQELSNENKIVVRAVIEPKITMGLKSLFVRITAESSGVCDRIKVAKSAFAK